MAAKRAPDREPWVTRRRRDFVDGLWPPEMKRYVYGITEMTAPWATTAPIICLLVARQTPPSGRVRKLHIIDMVLTRQRRSKTRKSLAGRPTH
jgi:hypothetical protein